VLPLAGGKKLGMGSGRKIFLTPYYLFLYDNMSCNITPQLISNKLMTH